MAELSDAHQRRSLGRQSEAGSFPVAPSAQLMPIWYPDLLASVSDHIATGRPRAIAAANREMLATYWAIGNDILARQQEERWGTRVIDRLSADLRERFPEARGYSPRNLKYMRAFAAAWPEHWASGAFTARFRAAAPACRSSAWRQGPHAPSPPARAGNCHRSAP